MTNSRNEQNITISNSKDIMMNNIENKVNISTSKSENQIVEVFAMLKSRINRLPDGIEKNIAQNAIEGLEDEAQKGREAEGDKVYKWLNFLLEISPDIGQVAIDTFLNPIKGLSTVFQKVAEKAKSDVER